MPRIHFLNVRNGDCSIIQHMSGRTSVIDVNCAFIPAATTKAAFSMAENYQRPWKPISGNYGQKFDEDNPIEYRRKLRAAQIFRFILTHPDMDHLGGVRHLFAEFRPLNFWDTANTKEPQPFGSRTDLQADWEFYKNLRDTSPREDPTRRLVYHSGDNNEYYKTDGLFILAPTPELVAAANKKRNWNDASYVILYYTQGKKILFAGDSEDETWKHILTNWRDAVSNLDILIAPHHGRHSGRSYEFLGVTKPKLTLYGNAASNHLAYHGWSNRNLLLLTNNEAGYVVLDILPDRIDVYVKNEKYATNLCAANNRKTRYNEEVDGWLLGQVV